MLTFAGMLALLLVYFGPRLVAPDSDWRALFQHMSYIELWENTLTGKLVPRMLLFPLSLTVFFLFCTVKVLESRKWR